MASSGRPVNQAAYHTTTVNEPAIDVMRLCRPHLTALNLTDMS